MPKDADLSLILKEIQSLRSENKADFEKLYLANDLFNKKLDKISKKLNDHESRLVDLELQVAPISVLQTDFQALNEHSKSAISLMSKEISTLKAHVEVLEINKRTNNLIIVGIPIKSDENQKSLSLEIKNFMREKLGIDIDIQPNQVHRSKGGKRILIKTLNPLTKADILKNSSKLKGTNFFISHDYTVKQEYIRYRLRCFVREEGAKFISQFMVIKDGKKYIFDESTDSVIVGKFD